MTVLPYLFLFLLTAHAQVSPELVLLGQIRKHMTANLDGLPNYLCTEVIDRTQPGFKDRVRVEVVMVNGQEMFAWPGSSGFQDGSISALIPGGLSGTGDFGIFAHNVFRSSASTVRHAGRHQTAERFDFIVPALTSGYRLKTGSQQGVIGYAGSFWVDAGSLDVIRIDVDGTEIPENLDCSRIHNSIRYRRVRLAQSDFLLPASAEKVLIDRSGRESRNAMQFTACRQYAAESSITFEPAPVKSPAGQPAAREFKLPADISLEMALETVPAFGETAVGDPVSAKLVRAVKLPDGTSIPKGAMVSGRYRRLEQRTGQRTGYVVGIEFFAVAFSGRRGLFSAQLTGPRMEEPLTRYHPDGSVDVSDPSGLEILSAESKPGVGVIRISGKRLFFPRGTRMEWRTQ